MDAITREDTGAGFWGLSAVTDNVIRFCAMRVEREWLNAKALAQYLGVAEMTLHRWRKGYTDTKGRFHEPVEGFPQPSIGIGNPLWKRSEIDEFLSSKKAA